MFIVSTNVELKHACLDINPPQHIGFQNKHRRGIIYHKVQFKLPGLMLFTSSIPYKILSTSVQHKEKNRRKQLTTSNSKLYRDNQNAKL